MNSILKQKKETFLFFALLLFLLALGSQIPRLISKDRTICVLSSSMEPRYQGPGFVWECPACNRKFRTSLDLDRCKTVEQKKARIAKIRQTRRFFCCPHCGFGEVPIQSAQFQDGNPILLPMPTESSKPVHRWDVHVYRKDNQWRIKRIVGLPGELVQILNGDVYINGEPNRRTLDQLEKTAVPLRDIHRIRFADRTLFLYQKPMSHLDLDERRHSGFIVVPITNQSEVPRLDPEPYEQYEFVRDFLLRGELLLNEIDERPLAIMIHRGDAHYLLNFDLKNGEIALFQNQNDIPTRELQLDHFQNKLYSIPFEWKKRIQKLPFLLISCDHQIRFVLAGHEIFSMDLSKEENNSRQQELFPISIPFILFDPAERLHEPVVQRDLHYSSPKMGSEPTLVATDQYYLLGDNSPISLDSRSENRSKPHLQLLKIIESKKDKEQGGKKTSLLKTEEGQSAGTKH